MIVFVFRSVVSFHWSSEYVLQPTNAPFDPNMKPDMHLIISGQDMFVNIRGLLCSVDPSHYEHVLTLIPEVTKMVLKICLRVSKVVAPPLVKIGI